MNMTDNAPGPLQTLQENQRAGWQACWMCGKRAHSAHLEAAFTPDGLAKILCRQCRIGSAELLEEQRAAALDALTQLTADLIESHMEELESGHMGDADHDGEAPESCSYCRSIQTAREVLQKAARDVSAITTS